MKRFYTLTVWLMILALLLCACGEDPAGDPKGNDSNGSAEYETAEPIEADFAKASDEMFTMRDYNIGYDKDDAIHVTLTGDGATASSPSVRIEGSTVTLTEDATYYITGNLSAGSLVVDMAEDAKPQLVLDGVDISCDTGAALYVRDANKVFVTLTPESENTLVGGSPKADGSVNVDGAIFSRQDLTLNGEGSLTVSAPSGHGIVCKDDLVLTGGSYTVNASSHGLDANNSVRITGASLDVTAGKDGVHVENDEDTTLGFVYLLSGNYEIDATGDGISAGTTVQIEGGHYEILSGGGHEKGTKSSSNAGGFPMRPGASASTQEATDTVSAKGLKADGGILINGGSFSLDCADDAVHAKDSMIVNGGEFTVSTGDDGFHADNALQFTAGKVEITESYEGLEAQELTVLGGQITLVASDDGLNAAGGMDGSATGGAFGGGDRFGGHGGPGGPGGMGGGSASNGSIVISGGTLYIQASGDGLDANGTLRMTGGFVTVCGPTTGDTATLDYDSSAVITNGTFIGTGASGMMAQTFSDAEQGLLSLNVGNQSAGTAIVIQAADGTTLVDYAPALPFAVVIVSTPEMEKGASYTVTVGSYRNTFQAN